LATAREWLSQDWRLLTRFVRSTYLFWVAGAVVGLVVGLLVVTLSPALHAARATVLVTQEDTETGLPDIEATRALLPTLRAIFYTNRVLGGTSEKLAGSWAPGQLRTALELYQPVESLLVHVVVRAKDARQARTAVSEIVRHLEREASMALPGLVITQVDPPENDILLVRPTAVLWPVGGGLTGLTIGGVLAVWWEARKQPALSRQPSA